MASFLLVAADLLFVLGLIFLAWMDFRFFLLPWRIMYPLLLLGALPFLTIGGEEIFVRILTVCLVWFVLNLLVTICQSLKNNRQQSDVRHVLGRGDYFLLSILAIRFDYYNFLIILLTGSVIALILARVRPFLLYTKSHQRGWVPLGAGFSIAASVNLFFLFYPGGYPP